MPLIQTEALRKEYRVAKRVPGAWLRRQVQTVHALDGVAFSIEAGESVGLLGPNGAGKSTLVKVISGILVPTSGRCIVENRVPWKERKAHVRSLGVVFGQRSQLWWDVPVLDSLQLLRDLYSVPRAEYARNLDELVTALNVEALLHTPVRQLSLGQRMRCELVAALLHSPRLLLLDEPTIGLDAVSKLAVRSFLRGWIQAGRTTLLLTTHDMADIQALCPRALVIGHGRLLYDGTLHALQARYDTVRIVQVEYEDDSVEPRYDGIRDQRAEGLGWRVSVRSGNGMDTLVKTLQQAGNVRDLRIESQSIDELIAHMYEDMQI